MTAAPRGWRLLAGDVPWVVALNARVAKLYERMDKLYERVDKLYELTLGRVGKERS